MRSKANRLGLPKEHLPFKTNAIHPRAKGRFLNFDSRERPISSSDVMCNIRRFYPLPIRGKRSSTTGLFSKITMPGYPDPHRPSGGRSNEHSLTTDFSNAHRAGDALPASSRTLLPAVHLIGCLPMQAL